MKRYAGELLSRRIIGQCGYALYAMQMESMFGKLTDDENGQVLKLCHALGDVVRNHGDDVREANKHSRYMNVMKLRNALDAFVLDADTNRFAMTAVVLFRLRWMLKDAGVLVRYRTIWDPFYTEPLVHESPTRAAA